MRPLLELANVSKYFRHNWTYRRIRAVEDLSLAVNRGEIYGVIGHNGAGKTTTFKMLVGLLRPSSGRVLLDGKPLDGPAGRAALGFSPEQPYFYDYLTVRETLTYYGQLYGMSRGDRQKRMAELVERFHLGPKLDSPMRTLSKGNLQRVAVAQAILHRPRLALLDEPMSGLDPVGRKEMRDLITGLKTEGTTVLFSSHVLSDAEALCQRVAILAMGQLREVVDLSDEKAAPRAYRLTVLDPSEQALQTLSRLAMQPPTSEPPRWTVLLQDQGRVHEALAVLQAAGTSIEALVPVRPSLEERFLQYVPRGVGDA
jgi:ABC-2 type transport system ATP-binding protein